MAKRRRQDDPTNRPRPPERSRCPRPLEFHAQQTTGTRLAAAVAAVDFFYVSAKSASESEMLISCLRGINIARSEFIRRYGRPARPRQKYTSYSMRAPFSVLKIHARQVERARRRIHTAVYETGLFFSSPRGEREKKPAPRILSALFFSFIRSFNREKFGILRIEFSS